MRITSMAISVVLLCGLSIPAARSQSTGTVEGIVRVNGNPLPNALIFALNQLADQYFAQVLTSIDGTYRFTDVPAGELNVLIIAPVGFVATAPAGGQALINVVTGETASLNFELEVVPAAGEARSKGYWKHQATVHFLHRGHAQESESDMNAYLGQIRVHFDNQLDLGNAVMPTPADGDGFYELYFFFNNSPGFIENNARQEFLALLFNVVSNRLHTLDVISPDGATVSQALQQIALLLHEGYPGGDDTAVAKDLAERLNSGRQLAAGSINTSLPVIPFAPRLASASPLARVTPNPMVKSSTLDFELGSPGRTSVRVFDVSGRLVRTLIDGEVLGGRQRALWDGRSDAGRPVGNGVYFYRVEVPGASPLTARFVVIGR